MSGAVRRASVPLAIGVNRRRTSTLEATPYYAIYEIKISSDASSPVIGDGAFIWAIPPDIAGGNLVEAQAYVSSPSVSGALTVMVRNVTQAVDMLSTAVTIDVGDDTSYTAATPSVVNPANSLVALGDLISIDVDAVGSGAKGLGVIITFP